MAIRKVASYLIVHFRWRDFDRPKWAPCHHSTIFSYEVFLNAVPQRFDMHVCFYGCTKIWSAVSSGIDLKDSWVVPHMNNRLVAAACDLFADANHFICLFFC